MTTDHTTLAGWLPLLQHPEVGERIREAAGVTSIFVNGHGDTEVWLNGEGWGGCGDEIMDTSAIAALALGGLAVLAADRGPVETWSDGRTTEIDLGNSTNLVSTTIPAAVLTALYSVYGPFGDGG